MVALKTPDPATAKQELLDQLKQAQLELAQARSDAEAAQRAADLDIQQLRGQAQTAETALECVAAVPVTFQHLTNTAATLGLTRSSQLLLQGCRAAV